MFMIHLVNCIEDDINEIEKKSLQDVIVNLIQVLPGDHQLAANVSHIEYADNIEQKAKFWIKRIHMMSKLQTLIRKYRYEQTKYLKQPLQQ